MINRYTNEKEEEDDDGENGRSPPTRAIVHIHLTNETLLFIRSFTMLPKKTKLSKEIIQLKSYADAYIFVTISAKKKLLFFQNT